MSGAHCLPISFHSQDAPHQDEEAAPHHNDADVDAACSRQSDRVGPKLNDLKHFGYIVDLVTAVDFYGIFRFRAGSHCQREDVSLRLFSVQVTDKFPSFN